MPVITTAFDADFFDEPVIESDRIESPCKRKCSKKNFVMFEENNYLFLFLFKNAI